ncbi:phage tail assembly chaperone [Pseudomonas putida]|uniref:Phage tail assembly chaperone-like domain-containing protein n=1 Tax=Pseudomonas putida TaxID=303 RepID=A0A1Q9QWT0_PSEPU|nr:phage tail assembly chaperone [Pseudomonas putida]OLS59609.1 hypothetical protein PSEMO_55800 [Pseudomonas putida]
MLFSVSTECFYDPKIHEQIPDDAIEVTLEEFQQLSTERNAGKRIVYEGGKLLVMEREPVVLSQEEIEAKERVWRDSAIADAQWLRDRHRDELELGLTTTLTAERFTELLVYLQALRDWPQSASFPEIEERPVSLPWMLKQPL